MSKFPWTPENEAELRHLRGLGWSGSQIALKFGVTRNAVIAKADRLGILSKPASSAPKPEIAKLKAPEIRDSRAGARPSMPRPRAQTAIPPKPKLAPALHLIGDCQPMDIMDLKSRQCRYPLGEGPDYLFCAAETPEFQSYCPKHQAICFQRKPPTDGEKKAAAHKFRAVA